MMKQLNFKYVGEKPICNMLTKRTGRISFRFTHHYCLQPPPHKKNTPTCHSHTCIDYAQGDGQNEGQL